LLAGFLGGVVLLLAGAVASRPFLTVVLIGVARYVVMVGAAAPVVRPPSG
jgi:hypothetical protein